MRGLISEILILIVTIASTVLVLNAAGPILEEGRTGQAVNDAKQILKTVDSVINQLAFESAGAKRSINIDLKEGRFIFSGRDDRIKIRIENTGLIKPSVRVEDEKIIFQSGSALDIYEADILNDGQTDLVLENSFVLFAIKKLGNSSEHVFINTSTLITQIRNKVQGIDIEPRSGIFINDDEKTSYGYGYTEMSLPINQQTGSVVLHMNSTKGIQYDAIFTLAASADFIELEVKHIQRK